MPRQAFLVDVTGNGQIIDLPPPREQLKKMQESVDGQIEMLGKGNNKNRACGDIEKYVNGIDAVANEEGLCLGLPRNAYGEWMLLALGFYVDIRFGIHGNILFINSDESRGLTKANVRVLETLLGTIKNISDDLPDLTDRVIFGILGKSIREQKVFRLKRHDATDTQTTSLPKKRKLGEGKEEKD